MCVGVSSLKKTNAFHFVFEDPVSNVLGSTDCKKIMGRKKLVPREDSKLDVR